MTQSILSEYSNLLLTIYRHAQELPVHEFQDALLDDVKPLLPFDSSMWGTATMTGDGIEPQQVCTPTDTELLACIAPHLMQALAINRLVHLDRLTGDVAR